jgi:Reverse transcriptase (RNA-dependent DNA polymerase)
LRAQAFTLCTMQAGYMWWHGLDKTYSKLGCIRSMVDEPVQKRTVGNERTILRMYTSDDITGASSTKLGTTVAEDELRSIYKLKDEGNLNFVIGIKVELDRAHKTISISHSAYVYHLYSQTIFE